MLIDFALRKSAFIDLDQLRRLCDDQQVLGILLFRRLGEVEGTRTNQWC